MAPAVVISQRNAVGNQFEREIQLTLDSTYAAGGWALTPQQVGLGANGVINSVQVVEHPEGYMASWDKVTGKLQVYRTGAAVAGPNQEAPNSLGALNTLICRLLVRGVGSPG
jgi:hypothetical protein